MRELIITFFLILLSISLGAQTSSEALGTFYQEGTPVGIEILEAPTKGFIIQQVFIRENGEVTPFEWQRTYLPHLDSETMIFSWMTGRHEDTPGTNDIIVYELEIQGDRLTGTYFFPNESRTPPSRVTFYKK